MKDWQFNVLFFVAVGGAIVMLFGEKFGLEIRPEAVTIFGTILAFVLTSRRNSNGSEKEYKKRKKVDEKDG